MCIYIYIYILDYVAYIFQVVHGVHDVHMSLSVHDVHDVRDGPAAARATSADAELKVIRKAVRKAVRKCIRKVDHPYTVLFLKNCPAQKIK